MFESFVTGQKRSRPRAKITLLLSFAVHGAACLAVLVVSFWQIERLPGKPATMVSLIGNHAVASPAPPALQAAAAAPLRKTSPSRAKNDTVEKRIEKRDVIQPVDTPDTIDEDVGDDADEPDDSEDESGGTLHGLIDGIRDGQRGGVANGDPDGVVGARGPGGGGRGPMLVPASMVRGRRIAGEAKIQLPEDVSQALYGRGVRRLMVTTKVCLSRFGVPTTVTFIKATGYPHADRKIDAGLRQWRYKPFRVRGQSVPVCLVEVLDYRLSR